MALLREKIGESEPGVANAIKTEYPYYYEEHKFLCVPNGEWLNLSPGRVNSKGQTVEEWLQELDGLY